MSNLVECPHCKEMIGVVEDVSDYDWNSGVSLKGLAEIRCPYCHEYMTVEATAIVVDVEVLHE